MKELEAMRNALNSEAGQELTTKLIEAVKAQNPNTTMAEWKDIQARFLAYMTVTAIREARA